MLKIKSLQKAVNKKTIIRSSHNHSDFSLQCNINNAVLSIRQSSYNQLNSLVAGCSKQNRYNNHAFRIMKRKLKTRFSSLCLGEDREKGIYNQVTIINVDEDQDKVIKALQTMSLGRKCEKQVKRAMVSKHITFIKLNKFYQEQQKRRLEVKVSLQQLYKYYLQFHRKQLKTAIMQGNLHTKIIKPFLTIFNKMKMELPVIHVKFWDSTKICDYHAVSKIDVLHAFQKYTPKLVLHQEIRKIEENGSKIYEDLYSRYQNIPFHAYNQQQQSNKLISNKVILDEQQQNEPPIEQQDHKSESKSGKTDRTIEPPKIGTIDDINEELRKLDLHRKGEDLGDLTSGCSERKSQIKQRFEERFKKQVEMLSADVDILMNL